MSIFKLTLPGAVTWLGGKDNAENAERLSQMFQDYGPFDERQVFRKAISQTMYKVCRRSIGDAIPDSRRRCVRSLASYYYDDGTPVLAITMIVGPLEQVDIISNELSSWPFADVNWAGPKRIAIPSLSMREKLAIDRLLPDASARTIVNKLRLRLDKNYPKSIEAIANYVDLYRHAPQFVRITI
jgi:hypothetical protein